MAQQTNLNAAASCLSSILATLRRWSVISNAQLAVIRKDSASVALFKTVACRLECRRIVYHPNPERHHSRQQPTPQFGKRVIHPWRHFPMVLPDDQAVTFQLAQGSGEHPLRYAIEPPGQFRMAQRSSHAQGMYDSERPSVSGMCQDFALQAVVLVSQ